MDGAEVGWPIEAAEVIHESSGLMVILVRLDAEVRARACSGVILPKANLPRMRADSPVWVLLLLGSAGGGGGIVSAMERLCCAEG